MFPGSDSRRIIGVLAVNLPGFSNRGCPGVARLGESEIIGIHTICVILIRLRACSFGQ